MSRPLTFVFIVAATLNLGECTKARKESSVENTPEQAQAIVAPRRGAVCSAFNRGDIIDAAVKPFDPADRVSPSL